MILFRKKNNEKIKSNEYYLKVLEAVNFYIEEIEEIEQRLEKYRQTKEEQNIEKFYESI